MTEDDRSAPPGKTQDDRSAPPELLRLRRRQRISFGAAIHTHDRSWCDADTQYRGDKIILERPDEWQIRDQGQRGTCVAHAAVACLEHFVFREDQRDRDKVLFSRGKLLTSFSEQFLHYNMRRFQSNNPGLFPDLFAQDSDRTWLRSAQHVLRDEGICLEKECRYDPYWRAKLGSDGAKPSEEARESAMGHRFSVEVIDRRDKIDRSPTAYIVDNLRDGNAVAVSIPVQVFPVSLGVTNWTTWLGRFHGIVRDPDGDCPDGHAVCILGFLPDLGERCGGWFLFRNSWGLEWASEALCSSQPFAVKGLPGRGYGVLSAHYVNEHVSEMMTVKKRIS